MMKDISTKKIYYCELIDQDVKMYYCEVITQRKDKVCSYECRKNAVRIL